jgi:hypothetical protein
MSEATGLLPDPMIDRFETILSSMPKRIFERADLSRAMKTAGFGSEADLDQFGEYLFLQGAIGNYRRGAGYVQFYHRRDAYKWQKEGPWVMHSGLVYAFNVQWADVPTSPELAPEPRGRAQEMQAPSKTRRNRARTRRGRVASEGGQTDAP